MVRVFAEQLASVDLQTVANSPPTTIAPMATIAPTAIPDTKLCCGGCGEGQLIGAE